MRAAVSSVDGFRAELSTRIREIEKRFANRAEAAKAAGVAKSSFQRWVEGKADPSFEGLSQFAAAAGVSLDWLAFGRGTPEREPEVEPRPIGALGVEPVRMPGGPPVGESPSHVSIPRYDVRLSAGDGAFVERAELLDHIPFTPRFLRRKLGRGSTEGLVIVEAAGDSMEPTISDGDLVMIDTTDRAPQDGLYALILEDALMVKRVHRMLDGLEIASDNRELYRPIVLPKGRMDEVQVVGRVRWLGRVV